MGLMRLVRKLESTQVVKKGLGLLFSYLTLVDLAQDETTFGRATFVLNLDAT